MKSLQKNLHAEILRTYISRREAQQDMIHLN